MLNDLERLVFAEPLAFLLLLLIPLLLWYEKKIKKYPSVKYSSVKLITMAQKGKVFNPRLILLLFRVTALFFLITSIARPQIVKANAEILTEGINIVLAIDTSGSMRAIDLEIDQDRTTRLEVVKKVVTDFIQRRKNDPIGLVVFGTEAFTQSPITLDYGILSEFLKNIEIGIAGESTAIGNALGLSVKRLKDTQAISKVIILLTDGTNNAGRLSPEKAAEIAAQYKIKVYTVGVGTSGDVPFLQDTFLGPQIVTRKADLDEQALKMIAEKTGGKYYRATNTEELQSIYNDIDKLEKSEVKVKTFMEYQEVFHLFLFPGLILLLLELVLANTRLIHIP